MDPVALAVARERRGLTQTQLAEAIGVAGGERVSRWEKGHSQPRVTHLRRIAETLDVSIRELLAPGERDLTRLRTERGFEMAELATATDIPASTLWRWEGGTVPTSAAREHVEALAEALGVDVDEVRAALRGSKG